MEEECIQFPWTKGEDIQEISFEDFKEAELHEIQRLKCEFNKRLTFHDEEEDEQRLLDERCRVQFYPEENEVVEDEDEWEEEEEEEEKHDVAFLFLIAPRSTSQFNLWNMSMKNNRFEELEGNFAALSVGSQNCVHRMYQRMFKGTLPVEGLHCEEKEISLLLPDLLQEVQRVCPVPFSQLEHSYEDPSTHEEKYIPRMEERIEAMQVFLDATVQRNLPQGKLSFHYYRKSKTPVKRLIKPDEKIRRSKTPKKRKKREAEHIFREVRYQRTLQQDEALGRDMVDCMYSHFPAGLSLRHFRQVACVYSKKDIRKQIRLFQKNSRKAIKCYVIFIGHGQEGTGAAVLEKGVVSPRDLIQEVAVLDREKLGCLPMRTEFVAAQCNSYKLPNAAAVVQGSKMQVTRLTKKLYPGALRRIGLYCMKIPKQDGCGMAEVLRFQRHIQLDEWAKKKATESAK